MTVHSRDQDSKADDPWQLAMFRNGLKKRLRLQALESRSHPTNAACCSPVATTTGR
jgi:hypothetical protein